MVSILGVEVDLVRVALLTVGLALLWFFQRVVEAFIQRKASTKLKKSELFLTIKTVRFTFILAAAYLALSTFNVQSSDIFFSTTVIAAAVTLSASTFIGNFLAGVYVAVAKPFQYGDSVKIGNYAGRVHDISLMSTKLLTWEKEVVTFPSTMIMATPIVNYDLRNSTVKDNFEVRISHKTDLRRAVKLLKEAVLEVAKENKALAVEEKGAFEVQVLDLKGGLVTLLLIFTVDGYSNTFRAASDLKAKVVELFKKARIDLK